MNKKSLIARTALATTCSLLAVGLAEAAPLAPKPPPSVPAIPAGLTCTAEALNVSGFVDASGHVEIYNVPANQGAVRLRATCVDGLGNTVNGQSAPIRLTPSGLTHTNSLDFGSYVPVAARLTVSPPSVRLVGLGATEQITVGSTFADLTTGDVTAGSTGTTYRSSNPAVATVGADGMVKAIGPGSALIYALNDGAGGLTTVSVLPAELTSLSVIPSYITLEINPVFPAQPVSLQVAGLLSDSTSVDWSNAASGVTYTSADAAVAAVSPDGLVIARTPGFTTIAIVDSPTGIFTEVGVDISQSAPAPSSACSLPGFAYNVDLDGNRAFVADGPAGLRIVNVDSCAPLGVLALAGKNVVDVRIQGSLAALALDSDGIALVDVSTLANPSILAGITSIGAVRDVWISGNLLFVASTAGLFVYDVSAPATPVLVGSQVFAAPAQAVSADAARGVITVLTSAPSLEVISTSGPAWTTVSVPLPSGVNQARDVVLLGTSAYVANGRSGIQEIDVTSPGSPSVRSSSTLDFDALGVAVQHTAQGTFVAAADDLFVNAVPLFDPRLNNTYNIDFSAFGGAIQSDANGTGIALGEGFGVVTAGSAGIQVFRARPLVDNAGVAPTVSIVTPVESQVLPAGSFVPVTAIATDDVKIASVEIYVDGQLWDIDSTPPFNFFFQTGDAGTSQTIELQAFDLGGNVGSSLPVHVDVAAPPPPPPAGPFTLSAGGGHTCYRPPTGGIKCWGYNGVGALGDGTGVTSNVPVAAINVLDMVGVSAGGNASCGWRSNGHVGCWGFNGAGELGFGTVGGAEGATATDAIGLTDAVQVTSGQFFSCARRATGALACWGNNGNGRLGNGSGINASVPTEVPGFTDAIDIGVGVLHGCAVHAGGTVSCWGNNGNGQVGDGTFTQRNTPVDVIGISDAVRVSGGLSHSCAVHVSGAVSCWGSNGNGELGDGTVTQSALPVSVVGITDAIDVRSSVSLGGGDFSCAVRQNGQVACWGYGAQGQLGNGLSANSNVPVTVVGISDAVKIAAGWRHACSESGTGSVQCWGWNLYGQIGDGTNTDRSTPVVIFP